MKKIFLKFLVIVLMSSGLQASQTETDKRIVKEEGFFGKIKAYIVGGPREVIRPNPPEPVKSNELSKVSDL